MSNSGAPRPVHTLVLAPPRPMTDVQLELLQREDWYREEYAKKRFLFEGEIHVNQFAASEMVFENTELYQYLEEDEDEAAVPKVFTACRDTQRTGPCIVPSMDHFHERWKEFTEGMFEGMNWDNVVVAGGAVLACLSEPRNDEQYAGSDIDLFIHGLYTDEEANAKLRHIHHTVMRNSRSRGDIVRTKRACTILNQYPFRHVQVILRLYKNPGEVLLGFDIDCCAVGFNGATVFAEERFRRAITKRYNLVNRSRRSTTYEVRLFKYGKRGFAAAVPDLDKARVDPRVFEQHINEATNLRKLLLFEHSMLHPKSPFVASRFTNNTLGVQRENKRNEETAKDQLQRGRMAEIELLSSQHPSDYSDIHIPWGPQWCTNQILRAMREKERRHLRQFRRSKSQREAAGIEKKSTRRWRHRHRYVYGIDGAITGSSPWCIVCKQGLVGPLPEAVAASEQQKQSETAGGSEEGSLTTEDAVAFVTGPDGRPLQAAAPQPFEDVAEAGETGEKAEREEKKEDMEAGEENGEGKVSEEGEEKKEKAEAKETSEESGDGGRKNKEAEPAVGVLNPQSIEVTDTDTKKKRTIVFEAEDTTMTGPLVWLKNVPAYQDYDNGFVRHLLTSSFEPVNTNYEEGVYLEDRADMTEGHLSLVKFLLGIPPLRRRGSPVEAAEEPSLHTILQAETEGREFECDDCHGEFASLNQLRRHLRQGCDSTSSAARPPSMSVAKSTDPSAPQKMPAQLGVMTFSHELPSTDEEDEEEEEEEEEENSGANASPGYPPMRDQVDVVEVPTWALPLPETNPFAGPRPCQTTSHCVTPPSPRDSGHEHVQDAHIAQGLAFSSNERREVEFLDKGPQNDAVIIPPASVVPGRTQLLLLVGKMWKLGMLTPQERACLKQLSFQADEGLLGAVLAFDANQDVEDLVETLQLLVLVHSPPSAEPALEEAASEVSDASNGEDELE